VILVDTSVWIDHLRRGDDELAGLLDSLGVVTHPFVIGELALGCLKSRRSVLQMLNGLPKTDVATELEVLQLIENESLFGAGISYVDAHLIAAARLTADVAIWTRDKKFAAAVARLGLEARTGRKDA
jgi:predicted nucleic acid-binding protein